MTQSWRRPAVLVALAFGLLGCSFELDDTESAVAPAEPTAAITAAQTAALRIYVRFDAITLHDCETRRCSNAVPTQPFFALVSDIFGAGFVNGERRTNAWGGPEGRAAVAGYLARIFEPYNVVVTTSRPSTGPYVMVVVSGDEGGVQDWATLSGAAEIDCGNQNPNDVVLLYNLDRILDNIVEEQGQPNADEWHLRIAKLAAHELGHTFGLDHTLDASDFMHFRTRLTESFHTADIDTGAQNGTRACHGSGAQDSHAELRARLGAAPNAIPGLNGGPVAYHQIWLDWGDALPGELRGYTILRNGRPFWREARSANSGFVAGNLQGNQAQNYRVIGWDARGVARWTSATHATFTPPSPAQATPFWRYWTQSGTDHYYTITRDDSNLALLGYTFEGNEGRIFASSMHGTTPLFQAWCGSTCSDHYYTADWNEILSAAPWWQYERVAGWLFPVQYVGSVPLHRYWNGTGLDHLYTVTRNDGGLAAFGYVYERAVGFVYP